MTRSRALAVSLLGMWVSLPAAGADGRGTVTCEIRENGEPGSGVLSLQQAGKEVATGTCGKDLSAPAGTYDAVLRLDGALDGPERKQTVTVKSGASARLEANFATGLLEVRIASQGKRAAGMAVIKRGDKQIGTLGSGVVAHLSAGSYEVVARYRAQEKTFSNVTVAAGQRVTLDATFE